MHADPQALAQGDDRGNHASHSRTSDVHRPAHQILGNAGRRTPAAPVLGQHTREVLREHGFSDAEADQMAALGAVEMPDSIKAIKP